MCFHSRVMFFVYFLSWICPSAFLHLTPFDAPKLTSVAPALSYQLSPNFNIPKSFYFVKRVVFFILVVALSYNELIALRKLLWKPVFSRALYKNSQFTELKALSASKLTSEACNFCSWIWLSMCNDHLILSCVWVSWGRAFWICLAMIDAYSLSSNIENGNWPKWATF